VVNLLDSVVLRVAIWLVAVVTCGGNVFVIVCRLLLQDETNSHSLFIKNLAGNLTGATLFHFPECLLFCNWAGHTLDVTVMLRKHFNSPQKNW